MSTLEKEFEQGWFPLTLAFDGAGFDTWKSRYQEHFNYKPEKIQFDNEFGQKVWQVFQQYQVPVIELLEGTSKEAVCQVFEQVNTGGVTLTVFELMTASYAAEDFELRKDWEMRQVRLAEHDVLSELKDTDYLAAVTLLASYRRHRAGGKAVGCKRKDILDLELGDYKSAADEIEDGLRRAARFLRREKVLDARDLPYSAQLVPLAAFCAALGRRFEEESVRQKLGRWYWCGVFGELYGGANETRFATDIQDMLAWVDGADEPRTVRQSNFAPTRLLTMQTRNSAAYKGVMALLMKRAALDWKNGDKIEEVQNFAEEVDIHHIFPQAYCTTKGLRKEQWNSIVNKTPLTSETNRVLSGRAPSAYLDALVAKGTVPSAARVDEIVGTHLVAPSFLRTDDFAGFLRDRAARLLDAIEEATGKSIAGRDSDDVREEFGGPLAPRAGAVAPPVAPAGTPA